MVAQSDQATREPAIADESTESTAPRSNSNRNSASSRILGMTGPAGEPGLPPSRPSSIATAQSGGNSRRWSQAPPTGRGGVFSGIGPGSTAGSMSQSRPTTAASRTHVPLAAHGFFRPMSSQRLQQQRNQRPTSLLGHTSLYSEGATDFGGNPYRQSIGSNNTIRGQHPLGLHHDSDQPPPPSRGTDVTDRDLPDRTTANTTPTGAETVRSRGESITPLQRPRPQHLDLSKSLKADAGNLPTPGKSPRSFKSGFMIPSRNDRSSQMRPQGHEKLASAESTPRMTRKAATREVVKKELGKNHEYFSGNTAFCWGGRLQNTRDRPVNIATGLFIAVPAGLFLGFS
jgi:palmitoyltransferase ZDHHC9/14/18